MTDEKHDDFYIDSEDQMRCLDCDKWLEPGYYEIGDHQKAMNSE